MSKPIPARESELVGVDPLRQARDAFYSTFDRHCEKPLQPSAERHLGFIFQQTVAHAINVHDYEWGANPNVDDWVLLRVADAAQGIQVEAGDEVSVAELVRNANRVIRPLRTHPRTGGITLGAGGTKRLGGIFCDVYEIEPEDAEAEDPTTRSNADPVSGMLERARAHVVAQVTTWASPKKFEPEAMNYLTGKLFRQTIEPPIRDGRLDWDNDAKRRGFALRRLADIAELATLKASNDLIDRASLHHASSEVIRLWEEDCKGKFSARAIFCENFTHEDEGG